MIFGRAGMVAAFRYYLVTLHVPEVAVRFRDVIRVTAQSLRQHPFLAHYVPCATLGLKICGSCRSTDSRQSAFIALWTVTRSRWFGFCTVSGISDAFSNGKDWSVGESFLWAICL